MCNAFIADQDGFCGNCWATFEFISKPYCQVCGVEFAISLDVQEAKCGQCLSAPPPYNISRSLFKFNQIGKKAVHAFKYYDKTNFAKLFARLLCARYAAEIQDVDFVVPVPMHKWKRLWRMYNQAQLLAHEVAIILQKPQIADALIKTRFTATQTALSKKARVRNLKSSIKANSNRNIKDKTILLIDDVRTTGSTVTECSKILKQSGAKAIYILTIAAVI